MRLCQDRDPCYGFYSHVWPRTGAHPHHKMHPHIQVHGLCYEFYSHAWPWTRILPLPNMVNAVGSTPMCGHELILLPPQIVSPIPGLWSMPWVLLPCVAINCLPFPPFQFSNASACQDRGHCYGFYSHVWSRTGALISAPTSCIPISRFVANAMGSTAMYDHGLVAFHSPPLILLHLISRIVAYTMGTTPMYGHGLVHCPPQYAYSFIGLVFVPGS